MIFICADLRESPAEQHMEPFLVPFQAADRRPAQSLVLPCQQTDEDMYTMYGACGGNGPGGGFQRWG